MSRLDRLLTLLETGSSPSIRKAAAQQIGEIQKLYPYDLQALLDKVQVYLSSNVWDTRIAGGQAIESICANVPPWDPLQRIKEKEEEEREKLKTNSDSNIQVKQESNIDQQPQYNIKQEPTTTSSSSSSTSTLNNNNNNSSNGLIDEEFDLQFKNFDIVKVINYGAPLLASGGKEFDEEEIDPNMDPKELILKQKKKLKKQLGLDELPVKLESLDSLVEDKDIVLNKNAKAKKEKEEKKEDISQVLDTTGMSARERNKAKRKARSATKEKETVQPTKRFKEVKSSSSTQSSQPQQQSQPSSTKQHVTEQPQDAGKIVIESILDVEKAYNQDEWPFASIYNDLVIDLFSPTWEIRHGSLVGLREICKKHGGGGGKTIYTPLDKMDYVNSKWLEDFSLRLLCVITLDRFADYTSDQLVAPVRETCSQTLGIVVKYMDQESVLKVLDILLHLQNNKLWEVRHGGMLGIKYVVAVRLDLIDVILPKILPTLIDGLEDSDDDVRAVASETFHPISRYLVEKHIDKLPEILTILWDILLELDDLAVSTSSVLNLLSNFYSYPEVLPPVNNSNINNNNNSSNNINNNIIELSSNSSTPPHPHAQHSKLAHLVPRLYQFFRHNLYSVRLSSIKTIERLIVATPQDSKTHWLLSILPDLMRYIFQNIILEEKEDIVELSLSTWQSLVKIFKPNVIRGACRSYFSQWVTLLSTPPNTLLDKSLLLDASKNVKPMEVSTSSRKSKKSIQQQQQQQQQQNIANLDYLTTRSKIIGSTALGLVVRVWPSEDFNEIQDMFYSMLTSVSGLHKHLASLILCEAFSISETWSNQPPIFQLSPNSIQYINNHLSEELDIKTTSNYYMEATNIVQNKLLADLRVLSSSLLNVGFDFSGVELLNIISNPSYQLPYDHIMPYSIELVTNVYDFCVNYMKQSSPSLDTIQPIIDQLEARRKTVMVTIGFVEKIQNEYHTQVLAEMSSLLVVSNNIPSTVSPIVRSLMLSIRKDENSQYQMRSARALSQFTQASVDRPRCPNPKIISSMFTILVDDRTETPLIPLESPSTSSIKTEKELLLNKQLDASDPDSNVQVSNDDIRLAILARRGSVMFFNQLCKHFDSKLFESLPSLYETIFNGTMIKLYQQIQYQQQQQLQQQQLLQPILFSNEDLQKVVDEIQLTRVLLPVMNPCYHPQMIQLMLVIFEFVKYPKHQVQLMASKCIARFCQILTLDSMRFLIRNLLPLLGDSRSLTNRMGAIHTVSQIIRDMEMKILPYIVFFTIPILGCMSDQDPDQRRVATLCFAKLVKLMPLEKGVADPEGLDQDLIQKKQDERKFLEQLLDGSKVETYPLPIRINTELRKYQQDGVNWLAFLNKYKLHGILCDDMGLGKTLQTICIIAGDDYHRRVNYAEKGTPDFAPLPSLVVCPPSLVGHWFYEIKKFCSDASMKPMTYMGNPNERQAQRLRFKDHNVLIMSYDIMRNDIDILSEMHFNYCILDEGHIIKNAKTKLTQAAKRLQSNHRLILSGTPIQNNVLELWSLFDFLMPGFLGTEKLFNELYSKPILASKDPKCSQKDQEAGVLAMEALHRQVLPFLLRRLKEDVLADLPPKIIQDRYCNLSPLQIRLYDYFSRTQFKENIKNEVDNQVDDDDDSLAEDEDDNTTIKKKKKKPQSDNGGGNSGATHIFQALQYLRKLCGHPSFVLNSNHPQYNSIMKEFKMSPQDLLDINHSPKLVSLKELLLECGIGLSSQQQQQQLKSSTSSASSIIKNEIANEITSTTNQHRVLIFAQMKQMLDIVENELFKKHLPSVTYLRMDGTTESMKRHTIVNQFNSDPTIDVLLLTTHVGGLGLNLTGADTVIFLEHDWNPMKDLQAMDRAHRIGQKKVVNVYRLITSGTLEEKIMGLQKFKLNIANTVINQDNSSLQTMSTNELLNLFDYSDEQKQSNAKSASNNDYTNESNISETGEVTTSTNASGGGKLKNILDSLGELWDESQYTEEFNLTNFMNQLN